MELRVKGFQALSDGERVLQVMAYLCDVIKIREKGGNNRGDWVEAILRNVGLGGGYAWCAAVVAYSCDVAQVSRPKGSLAAGVHNWKRWATKISQAPKRGNVCLRDHGKGLGHMGIVVRVIGPLVYSIEGNTGPGEEGSQRDGDGLYRRVRLKGYWNIGFIDL